MARRHGGAVVVHRRFGTATLTLPEGQRLEFATARTETYDYPGALPRVEPSSVVDDLRRRDFTINALAIALRPERWGELLDPFGGAEDLEQRRIRVLHPLSFVEDPTRILRAVRYEQRYHFRMEPTTEALARRSVADGDLGRISPERLRAELGRVFRERGPQGTPTRALARLGELGVWEWLAPGMRADERVLAALPGAIEWLQRAGESPSVRVIYLAALALELDPDAATAMARDRLRLPPAEAAAVGDVLRAVRALPDFLRQQPRPAVATAELRAPPVETLALLRATTPDPVVRGYLDRYLHEWRTVRLEIDGNDLVRAGIAPGPAVGAALRATLDAKLNGEIAGREAELAFALARLREQLTVKD